MGAQHYVDYGAVDVTYEQGGDDTFRDQWQCYRTRASRAVAASAVHGVRLVGHLVLTVSSSRDCLVAALDHGSSTARVGECPRMP